MEKNRETTTSIGTYVGRVGLQACISSFFADEVSRWVCLSDISDWAIGTCQDI